MCVGRGGHHTETIGGPAGERVIAIMTGARRATGANLTEPDFSLVRQWPAE